MRCCCPVQPTNQGVPVFNRLILLITLLPFWIFSACYFHSPTMHLRKRSGVTTIPVPQVIKNSGTFDGNDGKWSTFIINVNSDAEGLNGQNFKVLVSTSSQIVLVPGQSEWCDVSCAEKRGVLGGNGVTQPRGMEETNTWDTLGLYEIPLPYWYSPDLIQGTNKTLAGEWGVTQVGLGSSDQSSIVLEDRYVAWYEFKDYYMGSFGLARGQVGPSGGYKPTFLTQLKSNGKIASTSYGYTAGAWYRNNENGALGNLVLGGYDQSRLDDKNITIKMPNELNNTLAIGVPSILYSAAPNVAGGPISYTTDCGGGFRANIDSTLPYLILPDCICDHFERTFGLIYNETENLYFVNSTQHERNQQQNGTVLFKVAETSSDSDKFVNIELGYLAFDHLWTPVNGGNASNYFPIKKSKTGVYTLGRAFLQEAYIVVDYGRLEFTVAPARYTDSTSKEQLQIIYDVSNSSTADSPGSNGGLGSGAIAGTVVGIVLAFAIVGVLAFCWWRKRKTREAATQKSYETRQIDPTLAGQEVKYRRVSELTGSDIPNSPKTPLTGYYSTDHKLIPPISEMSPDSPPVEMYSPPPGSESDLDGDRDYFTTGKPHRRGVQRDCASSGHNTPGTPIAELPGDDGQFNTAGVSPLNSPLHSRGPSDTSLSTNIDERLADHKKEGTISRPTHPAETDAVNDPEGSKNEMKAESATETVAQQRPSRQRGLSDTTIASDSTAISQPTPEEEACWASQPTSGGQPLPR